MKKINLYSDVLGTFGYTRSLLFDSLKCEIHFLDNAVFSELKANEFRNISIDTVEQSFQDYLFDNNLIFDVHEDIANSFPLINLEWDFPSIISNAVICVTEKNCEFLNNILDLNFVSHFNFVFQDEINIASLELLFHFIQNQSCDSIELTFTNPIDDNFKNELELLIMNTKKIIGFNNYAKVEFISLVELDELKFNRHMNNLHRLDIRLSRSLDHYAEAQNHHTYFNRKLFIDKTGEIKNAPEQTHTFGNLGQINSVHDLHNIVSTEEFKSHWFIRKDNTDVCKDCEFRYLCTDNRLPIQRNVGEWYHESECGYNPYICKWDDEEGYLSLTDCNVRSNENGFSIDHKKIELINESLWTEEIEVE